MVTQTISFGDVENVVFNGNEIDILNLDDTTVWKRFVDPEWLNYTGIDAAGNYEGTAAYDGTAVAYGLGKPTITTATDGTETVRWDEANALNDEYFTALYGDQYVKGWNKNDSIPLQVVEDTLVIPDTYRGKPVTTLLDYSFHFRSYSTGAGAGDTDERYQPFFYQNIVFGANITTINDRAFGHTTHIDRIEFPATVTFIHNDAFGPSGDSFCLDNSTQPRLVINSNLTSAGISNHVRYVTFNPSVTEVFMPLDAAATTVKNVAWTFKHAADAPLTITYNSKPKTAQTVTIYTDNNAVLNYDWANNANITPTFKSLSS